MTSEINSLSSDVLIEVMTTLIVAAIIGAGSFMFVLYKCIHKQANRLNSMGKGIGVVLKLLVEDTRKNHPDSEHITEIDKIYKEIVE